jgi:hypothetical protein
MARSEPSSLGWCQATFDGPAHLIGCRVGRAIRVRFDASGAIWRVHVPCAKLMQTSSDCLSEVAPSELSARTRLQVPLEFDRWRLFVELDHHQRSPGTMSGCVWGQSVVVRRQPGVWVRRDPHVIFVWTADALQDVDKPSGKDQVAETAKWRPHRIRMISSCPTRTLRFLHLFSARQIAVAGPASAYASRCGATTPADSLRAGLPAVVSQPRLQALACQP